MGGNLQNTVGYGTYHNSKISKHGAVVFAPVFQCAYRWHNPVVLEFGNVKW